MASVTGRAFVTVKDVVDTDNVDAKVELLHRPCWLRAPAVIFCRYRNRPSQWNYPQVGGRIDYRHRVRDFDIQISGTDATARDSNDLPWLKDAVITADTKLRGKCSCSEFEDTKPIGNCREAGCRPASYSSKPQSFPITCMQGSPCQRYALHDPCQLF